MPFLNNAWYAGGWDEELDGGRTLARTILAQSILFFRRTDGSIAALRNQCAHRYAPLHLGRREGDAIRCAYHGLQYDSDGRCIHSPQASPISGISVRSYPAEQRDGLIWIWMGDRDKARVDLIPNYSFYSDAKPSCRFRDYIHSAGHYELMSDNIMDLSHIDFLHPSSLGPGSISIARPKVTASGDMLHIKWESTGQKAAPIYDPFLPEPGGLVDQELEVVWRPAALMFLTNRMTPVGYPREDSIVGSSAHLMTPESETSTHYFYLGIRNFDVDNAEGNAARAASIKQAFALEDKPMVEAVQGSMGDCTDLLDRLGAYMPADAGALRARKQLKKLIQQELGSAERVQRPPEVPIDG